MQQGALISIEGIEGVGKSTIMQTVCGHLDKVGHAHVRTREPGGSPFAEQIRQLVLSDAPEPVDADCELLLISAARAQHIAQTIKPALAQGQWVVTDRFIDATFAYQGGGRELDVNRIASLAEWTLQGLWPDLTLLLDASIDVALSRIEGRGEKDRFEQEQTQFFDKVRAAYHARAEQDPARIKVVNAEQSFEAVQAAVIQKLDDFITHHVQD